VKLIRILGLTAVAAIASMAFLSASASADNEHIVLCEKAELNCTSPFPNPTTITAHAIDPKLLTNLGTVLCPESLIKVEILNVLGTSLVGHIKELVFNPQCKLGLFNCTVTTENLGLVTGTKTGALTAKLDSDGKTAAHIECASGSLNCTFGGKPPLSGSSTAAGVTTVTANEAELTKTGGNCPTTSKWDATYTALGTMWIES